MHVHVRSKQVLFKYFPQKRRCVECHLTFRSVRDTYKHHGANAADQIKQDTYETLTLTSFIFNIISLYSERQKRGSWEQVLITSATARHTEAGDESVYQTTWYHIQDDYNIHIHCCENLWYHLNDIWCRVRNNESPHVSHTFPRKNLGFKAQIQSVQYTQFSANSHPSCTSATF